MRYALTPKQWEYATSDADEVLLSGAWGAGKSYPLCVVLYTRALFPGAREGLFRRTLQKLYETTLVTLLKGDGQTPPVIPKGTYTQNQQRRTIEIHGGGTIFYGPAETIEDVNAHNLTGAHIDECNEVREEIWEALGARCRVRVQGLKPQLRGACNPSTPSHYLAKRFGIRRNTVLPESAFTGDPKNPIRCHAIMTRTFDNPHLPPEALARYASYTGITRRRYVEGEWVGSDGLIFDAFSRDTHVTPREGPWSRLLIGIDDATTVEACILHAGVDADGRVHVISETQRAGMLLREKIAAVEACGPVEAIIVDPAAAALKAELREHGHTVIDADNRVEPGIQIVREMLDPGHDGTPKFTIDPSCSRLIEQMESYERNPNTAKETPIKRNDHGVDSARYLLAYVYRPPALVFDTSGLREAQARAEHQPRPVTGLLTHTHPAGREQDLSIANGVRDEIHLEPAPQGPLQVWASLAAGHPDPDSPHILFAAAGDGGAPSVVLAADVRRRALAAQWTKVTTPERFARLVAMLALWFGRDGRPCPIQHIAGTINTPGLVLGQHLARLHAGSIAWEPTPGEFAEAVGLLRGAWESGQFTERDPAIFATARQYVYAGTTMMHASLVASPERRSSHADGLIARAGLWRFLAQHAHEAPPEREAPPGSVMWHIRQRDAAHRRASGIRYG